MTEREQETLDVLKRHLRLRVSERPREYSDGGSYTSVTVELLLAGEAIDEVTFSVG